MKISVFNTGSELIMFVKMGNKKQNQSVASLFFFLCDVCCNLLCKGHKLEEL